MLLEGKKNGWLGLGTYCINLRIFMLYVIAILFIIFIHLHFVSKKAM
jgi:hypothetical protein